MKHLIAFSLALVTGASLNAALYGAPAKSAMSNKDCPITTTSDKFVADLNGKTGQFVGNVVVIQCDTRLRADIVRVTTVNNEADKVNASGNVVVDSPKSGTATGQMGVYDVPNKMVTLNGNVVLKKDKSVMRGQQLTVNLETGQAKLDGEGKSNGPGQRRVQAVFTPNDGAK